MVIWSQSYKNEVLKAAVVVVQFEHSRELMGLLHPIFSLWYYVAGF